MSPPPPSSHIPKLPSRRVGAMLTTAMLALGIALGALIGPGPVSSLASAWRAALLTRLLALTTLGSGSQAPFAPATSPPPSTHQPRPSTSQATSADGHASAGAAGASSPSRALSAAPRSTSPSTARPAPNIEEGGGDERATKTKPLPPIAAVWLIELPYATSVENALKQSVAAPYLNGQLRGEGTVLSGYSSLAAGQLAGAAALLSGQVNANVRTLSPPACGAGAPCPSGEPAGLQAADAFLAEVVPKILASPSYTEHGLLVITFGASDPQGTPTTSSSSGANEDSISYPPGSVTSTLSAAGAPAGALLLSPFLGHVGTRIACSFNPLDPHESLEGLLRIKHKG